MTSRTLIAFLNSPPGVGCLKSEEMIRERMKKKISGSKGDEDD